MSLESKVTLRVFSNKLTLEQISNVLGKPSYGSSIGDVYSRQQKKREHTFWGLESLFNSNPVGMHIAEMLEFVDINYEAINQLKQNGCTVDFICLLSSNNGQGGFSLSLDIMQSLVERDLAVTFDFYAD